MLYLHEIMNLLSHNLIPKRECCVEYGVTLHRGWMEVDNVAAGSNIHACSFFWLIVALYLASYESEGPENHIEKDRWKSLRWVSLLLIAAQIYRKC